MTDREIKYYITTDTHFNHDMLWKEGYRPKGYEALIIKRHHQVLSDSGWILIHLGDVALGGYDDLKFDLDYIRCRKVLVRGNHDGKSKSWYLRNGFDFVCDSFILNGILFTHEPQDSSGGCVLNVHGHIHDRNHGGLNLQEFHRPLILEEQNYYPIELNKFLRRNKINEEKKD